MLHDINDYLLFITHRCMLRVVVDDGEATATFELADHLLLDIPSLSFNELVSGKMVYFSSVVVISSWWVAENFKMFCFRG